MRVQESADSCTLFHRRYGGASRQGDYHIAPPNRTLNRLTQPHTHGCLLHTACLQTIQIGPEIICSREKVCDSKRLHQPFSANLLKQLEREDHDVTHPREAITFVSHTAFESANEHSLNQLNPEPTCMRPDPLWPQPTSHE